MKKSNFQILILLIYSFLVKLVLSLASPIFLQLCIQPDNTVFYNVGRGIMRGLILYKDMVDLKTPYIYFLNGFASLIPYRHIGLYIVESFILFFTLYSVYKVCLLFIKNDTLALIGTIPMQCLLTIPTIIFGISATECYCLPFILYSFYMATKYFLSKEKHVSRKDSLIYGLLGGFSTMINLKTAFFFIVLYTIIFIRMIVKKEKFFDKVLFVIFGGFISVFPYLVYMFATDSLDAAIHCIFTLSIAYTNSHFVILMLLFIKYYIGFFLFEFLSFAVVLIMCKNIWIKTSYAATFIITLFYVSVTNHPYNYYLVSFYPFFVPLIIFVLKQLLKLINSKRSYMILITFSIFIICLNIVFVYPFTKKLYDTKSRFYANMKDTVTRYIDSIEDKKVLSLAYNPDIYMALDVLPSFPCFITMNNTYEALPNLFMQQAKYVDKALPDIITINRVGTYFYFPEPIRKDMEDKLRSNYTRVEDVPSSHYDEIFEIYIKNEVITKN